MDGHLALVIFIIAVALVFDFLNGFHDAANSIATVVSTRVLSPRAAVLLAAVCNFSAAFLLETKVASTIGNDIVHVQFVDPYLVMFRAVGRDLLGPDHVVAGIADEFLPRAGGGFAGAAVARAGWIALKPQGLLKVVPYIVIAPVVGMVLGRLMMMLMYTIFRKFPPRSVDHFFRRGQLVSASIFRLQPRHERRAKDNGHYPGVADFYQPPSGRRPG